MAELKGAPSSPRLRRIGLAWGLAVVVSVASGVQNILLGWNGIPLLIGGMEIDVTVYPPFILAVLLALWVGPTWGAIPIYLANLASALTSGLSLPMSAVFAVAGVIETLMLWGSLAALGVDPNLRRLRDVAWFLAAGLVSAVAGSLAAILWNSSHGLDLIAGQRIWRGWVIGDLLQLALVVLPILYVAGPRVRGIIDRQFVSPPQHEFSYTHGVRFIVSAFAVLALVVFLGVHRAFDSIELAIDARTSSGELLLPRLREIILVTGLLSAASIVASGMFSTALARLGERQRREALLDSLTGCYNRRSFAKAFEREAERSRRLGMGLGVLFLDLDRFKEINDEHGHEAGDLVLERLARRIEETLRATDLLFRFGGEEFVVLMPHTHTSEVGEVARRLCAAIEATPVAELPDGTPLPVTASIGAVATDRYPAAPAEIVGKADEACYQAKRQGRNRVVVAQSSLPK